MKYRLQNIMLCCNEHGQLKADCIYAELVDENGKIVISATLQYVLAAIRDRKLEVEGVKVEHKEYRGAFNSEVSISMPNIAAIAQAALVLAEANEKNGGFVPDYMLMDKNGLTVEEMRQIRDAVQAIG